MRTPRKDTDEKEAMVLTETDAAGDADGYLMEGETHINDKMWKPNEDGTITIHFNAGKAAINNLSSSGQPFNYIVRSYGISQKVMDDTWKPVKPKPLK